MVDRKSYLEMDDWGYPHFKKPMKNGGFSRGYQVRSGRSLRMTELIKMETDYRIIRLFIGGFEAFNRVFFHVYKVSFELVTAYFFWNPLHSP